MGARKIGAAAAMYASAVAFTGIAVGLRLVWTDPPATWEVRPVVLLGLLAIAGPVLSVSRQGYLPGRIVHQIGSAFAYALFFLAPPGAACAVLWASALADWLLNRRRPIQAAFNIGQLGLSLAAAAGVRSWLLPGFTVLADVNVHAVAVAVASLLAFGVVNQSLTGVVMGLVAHHPLRGLRTLSVPALLVEALCIVSGIGMAVFWQLDPWLMLLGVIPVWALMLLLTQISLREQELERREEDLQALQDLGLTIGSELDAERLHQSVVRVTTQALKARGAVLLVAEPDTDRLAVLAHEGVETPPPDTLRLAHLLADLARHGSVRLLPDATASHAVDPELAFLEADGILCAPLEILGRRDGLLLLFHGPERRLFDDGDVRRVEILRRFIHVALSNAELVRELRDVQEQLSQTEKMSAMGMLVSGVAHELNNPLTTVLGYAGLLREQEDDPARLRMTERLLGEAERAAKIVHNLLTFSRKRRPERRLADLNVVLGQALELREHEMRLHGIRVVRRLAPSLPAVLVDAHQFHQVFLNILLNAEDALKERRRPGRVVVESRDRGGWVQVTISDDGPGIAAAHLKKVFLPFFTTKGVGAGTGLGLSICYGIVQEHGGRIDVDSREQQGASFIVEVPVAPQHAESAAPTRPTAPAAPNGRLLVVDDDAAIGEMVREALEMQGWSVVAARDGNEALARVAESDFDALVVDLRMPGMDGPAFYDALRVTRPDLGDRVIFATGDTGSEDTTRFLEESGRAVLGKPYEIRDLLDAVSRIAAGSEDVH